MKPKKKTRKSHFRDIEKQIRHSLSGHYHASQQKYGLAVTRSVMSDDISESAQQELYNSEQMSLDALSTEQIILLEYALKKFKSKTYGICEMCDKEIPLARLKALPHTKYCVRCQETNEIN